WHTEDALTCISRAVFPRLWCLATVTKSSMRLRLNSMDKSHSQLRTFFRPKFLTHLLENRRKHLLKTQTALNVSCQNSAINYYRYLLPPKSKAAVREGSTCRLGRHSNRLFSGYALFQIGRAH